MKVETFGDGRKTLIFGQQKINLQEYGYEIEPKAHLALPGCLDLSYCRSNNQ